MLKRFSLLILVLSFVFSMTGTGLAQKGYDFGESYPLKSSIQFNPVGFLQFGPMVDFEIRVTDNFVLFPHVRFAGLGLLSHLSVDYDYLDVTSMAFGGGFRILPGSGKHRMYFGGVAEYGWGTGSNDWDDSEYRHSYISMVGNVGYRWRFSSMYIQTGGYLGLVFETEDVRTDYHVDYGNDVLFMAMLEFAIGFEF